MDKKMSDKFLFSLKIHTDFSEYNKYDWKEKKKDIEDWFLKNLDSFFVRRFLEITEDGLNFFFKMYHYEADNTGVVFDVCIFASDVEVRELAEEIKKQDFIKNIDFSIYDSEKIKEIEEDIPEELMALEG